jgi:hypothetical protein
MPTRIALADRVGYTVEGGPNGTRLVRYATRGETIEVDEAEAKRLDGIDGAVQTSGDVEARTTVTTEVPDVEEVALVAGIAAPQGLGVDLHDNARADVLTKYAAELGGDAGSGAQASTGSASDEELAAMKSADLIAYLNQHPDEVDRVEAANEAGENYASVTKAVEASRAAQAEAEAGSTE